MSAKVYNGSSLVAVDRYVHNGSTLVGLNGKVHNGSSLVTVQNARLDGPTPVLVSSATNHNGSGGLTLSATMPASLAVGDMVVIIIRERVGNSNFTATGFTPYMVPHTAGVQSQGRLVRLLETSGDVTAVGAAVTVNLSVTGRAVCRVLRISGARGVDVYTGRDSGSVTSLATVDITTTGVNRLLIGAHGMGVADRTATLPGTMTIVGALLATNNNFVSGQDALNVGQENIATASAIGTRTFSISGAAASQGVSVTAFAPVLV